MKLLGIDTASTATAVALSLGDGRPREARDDPPAGAPPGHTAELLPLAARLLARAGIGWSELDAIAVGLGPGTFTGLRVGVASARALAQSLGIDAIGVGSLPALALPALRERHRAGEPARVLAALDARRGEAFIAAYGLSESSQETGDAVSDLARVAAGHDRIGGQAGDAVSDLARVAAGQDGRSERLALVELLAPRPVPPERLAGEIEELRARTGDAASQWLAVGDGALLFAAQLAGAGVRLAGPDSPLHRISAAAVCELAHAGAGVREQVRDGRAQVLPEYGRRPDAELTLEGAAR